MRLGLIVTLVSLLTFFRRINVFPLRNWDEAWYAEASKNMASGRYGYLMQFWNGRYYFDHSPLYFWLSTPLIRLFGPGEWQARIVSAIAAVLCAVLVFMIGRKLVNEWVGFFSVLIFLTLGGVVMRFAHGNLDSLLTFLSLAAFYCYLKSEDGQIFSIFSGLFLGFGILVKSWGMGLFPLYLIFIYSLFTKRRLPRQLPLILAFAFLIFSWWYLLGTWKFGMEFVKWFALNPAENRLKTPVDNFSLDYFKFAMRDIGFWFIFPFIYLASIVKKKSTVEVNFIAAFLFVSLTYVSFLNFLGDKSGWYLIPAYPLLAIVLGYFIERLLCKNWRKIGIVLLLVLVFQFWNVVRVENIYPDRSRVGAELGVMAREIIPLGDEVILDDHDFTAFLYYSWQTAIHTIQNDGKAGEWWILREDELGNFLEKHPKTWIVTRRFDSLPLKSDNGTIVDSLNGYAFVRLY